MSSSSFTTVSTGPSFMLALIYALGRLGTPGLPLKVEQKQAIHAVYDGNDVFVWLPTRFGKSICSSLYIRLQARSY